MANNSDGSGLPDGLSISLDAWRESLHALVQISPSVSESALAVSGRYNFAVSTAFAGIDIVGAVEPACKSVTAALSGIHKIK